MRLGLLLARAGGRLRPWSIGAGSAIGVVLLLGAVAVPRAIYPDPVQRIAARDELLPILVFLLVPATMLLVTTGRLSSGVRDRRLAALRMIGLAPYRARVVAAVENGTLALAGASVGGIVFAAVALPVSRAIVDGPGWFKAPLQVAPITAACLVLAVVGLSVLVGIGPTWERQLPGAARSESTRRVPSPWRLLVLAVGLGMLITLAGLDPTKTTSTMQGVLLLGGATVSAMGIALVTPLVTSWFGNLLVRLRPVPAVLAGRAIQTDTVGPSRVVAGLGVAVFLAVGALGVEGVVLHTPQYLYAKQMISTGPQVISLSAGDPGANHPQPLPAADARSLEAVPGVHGIVPRYDAQVDCSIAPNRGGCPQVFVGTCAQLEMLMTAVGCNDAHATRIEFDTTGMQGGAEYYTPTPLTAASLRVVVQDPVSGHRHVTRTLPLAAQPVIENVAKTIDTWVYPRTEVAFVPIRLVSDSATTPDSTDVIADGGTNVQHRVVDWATQHGYTADPYPTTDLKQAASIRAVIWTLCGIALGVGLLLLALTAADRATERRRTIARQIMIGIPARILRTGQLLQVITPLLAAMILSIGSGLVLLQAYSEMAQITTVDAGTGSTGLSAILQLHRLVATGSWTALGVIILTGGLLVVSSTLPLIRTRLTPDLLRRE